ncbi:hypothetical protein KCU78_g5372, partial [Aureobasidium melanogenum]
MPVWSGSTDIGGDPHPDPLHAGKELRDNGFDSNLDPRKLLPNIFTSANNQFSEFLSAVTDRIQAARRTLGDARLTKELQGARLAINYFEDARLADQAVFRIPAMNEALKSQDVKWKVETKKFNGQEGEYTDVDIRETLKKHEFEEKAIKDSIIHFDTNWFAMDAKARNHERAIHACQAAANRVFGDCNR